MNMITNEQSAEVKPESAIIRVMQNLETFAGVDQARACILMCDLWQCANKEMLHDVCDSIDLWIENCDAIRFVQYLKEKSMSEIDIGRRKFYCEVLKRRIGD